MTTVVATHAVGDMETWLGGGDARKEIFAQFCSSYRIFKHADEDKVSIVWEDADIEKIKAIIDSPQGLASRAKHTVIDPLDLFVEISGGT